MFRPHPLMNKQKEIIFTKQGYRKLLEEKEKLEKKRVEVLERLVRAREMGDLSENSAYKASRMELSDIDRRLRQISYRIRFAKVVNASNSNTISVGKKVTINDGVNNFEYTIVGELEGNPFHGKISFISPLGKILLGKKIGDNAVVNLPLSAKTYKIIKISSAK